MIKVVFAILFTLLFSPLSYAQNWLEVSKKTAFDRHAEDYFGFSVGISGNYAIASCHSNDYDESGMSFKSQSGAAYIFEKDDFGKWNTHQKLVAYDRQANDVFGIHVAIDGNTAVVGAYGQDYDAFGANKKEGAGAAYIFQRMSNGKWEQIQKITASDRSTGDYFGYGVAISGDYILIAAPRNSTDASGGDVRIEAGAAYLYKRESNGTWSQIQKIVASDRASGDRFGETSLSISGKYVAIGVFRQKTDTNDSNIMIDAGAVYIYEQDGAGFLTQVTKLVASDRQANARFGIHVSLVNQTLGVGAAHETKDENGKDSLYRAGAAYFFERDTNGSWNQIRKVVAADRAPEDWFGLSIGLSDRFAFIGATEEDEDSSGINTKTNAGSVYVFTPDTLGTWKQTQKLVASDRTAYDYFGRLSVSGNKAILSSRWQDTDSAGNNYVTDAGAVYFFQICEFASDSISASACDKYISPSGRFTWANSGNYSDTIVNALGCDSILYINLQITRIDTSVNKLSPTLSSNELDATYKWISCDGSPVENNTLSSFTPQRNGRYAVELTKNGCVDTSSCITIDYYRHLEVNHETICSMIFPNPTYSAFTVDVGDLEQIHSVTLYDLNGREVRTFTYVPQSSVDIELDWHSAIYIVKVVTGSGAFYCNMVVQR